MDAERRLIRQAASLTEEIGRAADQLSTQGAEGALADALSRLTYIAEKAEGRLEPVISAIDRTMAELGEAQAGLTSVQDALTFDPGRLDAVEERLFAIRGLARKHNVQADDLPALSQQMAAKLTMIDAGQRSVEAINKAIK